jgi:hypothetical protein
VERGVALSGRPDSRGQRLAQYFYLDLSGTSSNSMVTRNNGRGTILNAD